MPSVPAAPLPESAALPPGRERLGERGFILAVTLVFAVLCALPYALAWSKAPDGTTFSGLLVNEFDQTYYLAAQRSAADDLPRRNRYTSERGAPGPVSPVYPLLGRVQAATGLPAIAVYHLPRVAATLTLPMLLAWLFRLCFPGRPDVVAWSLLLSLFVVGSATVAPWIGRAGLGSDRIPESNVLYSLTTFPHFALAHAGLVLAYGAIVMALRDRAIVAIAGVAAVGGVLIAFSHTFLLLPVAVVLVAVGVVPVARALRTKELVPTLARLAAAGTSLLLAAPFALAFREELARFDELQATAFPARPADGWWTWVLGYGLISPLFAAGVIPALARRRRDPATDLLLAWIVVQGVLMFTPLTVFQRRYSEGVVIALAAVAALAVASLLRLPATPPTAGTFLVALLAIGSLAGAGRAGDTGFHVPSRYHDLWAHVGASDVVLAGHRVSFMLPAFSQGTVYLARPVETLRYEAKAAERARYAEDARAEQARRWLRESGITMVVVDEDDRSFLPRGLDDPGQACLTVALQRPQLTAYRVAAGCS